MLGEQYKTSQYYWWDVIDRKTLKREGYIQIDCSDGGGDEKRNGNTNMWMAKHYVLPESDDMSLKFNVTSDNPTGAYVKISLYVEGNYFVLYDWQSADPSFNRSNIEISLKSLDSTLNFSGKEVTVVFEARDGGCNNGVGEACSSWTLLRLPDKISLKGEHPGCSPFSACQKSSFPAKKKGGKQEE